MRACPLVSTAAVAAVMLAVPAGAAVKKVPYPEAKVEVVAAYKPDAAFEAMRQGMLWLSIGPQDRPFYDSYLKRFPGDTVMRDKLSGSLRQAKQDPLAVAVNEAYKLSDQGFNDQAIARFEGVLKTDPNYVDAIAGIGIVRLRQERFAEARDQLMKAIRLAPDRQSDWAAALDSANFWSAYHEAVALRELSDAREAMIPGASAKCRLSPQGHQQEPHRSLCGSYGNRFRFVWISIRSTR